jgi:hypothetical protein
MLVQADIKTKINCLLFYNVIFSYQRNDFFNEILDQDLLLLHFDLLNCKSQDLIIILLKNILFIFQYIYTEENLR